MPRPHRVRLSRRKGFRLTPGAILVARPSKWGNPYKLGKDNRAQVIEAYRRDLLAGRLRISVADVRRELKGRILACWCPLDLPCHGDVLLAVANGRGFRLPRAKQSAPKARRFPARARGKR